MEQTINEILALWPHETETAPERGHVIRLLQTFEVETVRYGVLRVGKKFAVDPSLSAESRGKYLSAVCRKMREVNNVNNTQQWIPASWLAQQ